MWSVFRGHHHLDELKWHTKYGKIVRVAPNLVAISDVDEINQIYGIGTKFIKSPFYDLSAVYDEEGLVPDPFVIRHDKGLHSRMKRNAANAYSMNGLVQFEPWINTVMDRLVAILDKNASSGTVCDLGNLLKMFAMDAVCTLTMGRDLSYMEKGDHLGFFPTLDLFTSYMSIMGHVPWLHPVLLGNPTIAKYMTGSDKSGTALFDLATKELERTRREPPAEDAPMTFLARLGLNQDANPKSITDREIITHAFGNLSAGSDTTAAAMRSVFYNILRSPRAYARLAKDVRENLQLPVTFTKAYAIPYLRAVIQEAMRLHPSVGQLLGRVVSPTGATIGKYYLAPGTEVEAKDVDPYTMVNNAFQGPNPGLAQNPNQGLPANQNQGIAANQNQGLAANPNPGPAPNAPPAFVMRPKGPQLQDMADPTFLQNPPAQRPPLGPLDWAFHSVNNPQLRILLAYENPQNLNMQVWIDPINIGSTIEHCDPCFQGPQGQIHKWKGPHTIAYLPHGAKLVRGCGWTLTPQGELINLSVLYLPINITFGKTVVTIGEVLQHLMNKVKDSFPHGPALIAGGNLTPVQLSKTMFAATSQYHGTVKHLIHLCDWIGGVPLQQTYY
ncbi:Cytochrome P450 monooxygenase [Colletotrichum siamense]|uniref:Cytochrome P450 monooxygenase n=1 Tax=Colletotrichum siamense TaxID=690259 RepID=A0A9P5EYW4_COLSI|nr:Cytochrome P450 monooxygenase [Colletotrichum siamense]KAF4863285.1 Cytochrome P450 monooxygenase [Colletotrichum siamense]